MGNSKVKLEKLVRLQRKMRVEAVMAIAIIKMAAAKAGLRSNMVDDTIVSSTGRCYR